MYDSWKDFFISIFNRGIFFDASTPIAYLINKIVNICLLLIWLFTIVSMCLSPAGQDASNRRSEHSTRQFFNDFCVLFCGALHFNSQG